MILVTFKQQFIGGSTLKPRMDFKEFENLEQVVDWYQGLGDELYYRLGTKNRILSPSGWDKRRPHDIDFLQAKDTRTGLLTTVQKIISDEGILFEDVKHCSEKIVQQMALKCEIRAIAHKDI